MDPHCDRATMAGYHEALLGGSPYPPTAPVALAWAIETLVGPLGDPEHLGRNPVVVLHGDHHQLVRDVVWGRELLPFDVFFATVPKWTVGAYRWSVMDQVRSREANDLVEVRIVPHTRNRQETLASRYVDWGLGGSVPQDLHQDVYDAFRRGGVAPRDARTLAAATVATPDPDPGLV